MKRIVLFALVFMAAIGMSAGDVTPTQALQKATRFVQTRAAKGNGARLAPGQVPQLTLAARTSGLYIYNVADNNGYVIVSPDDRTEAILGFSDSGSFNADNIPSNMQAWLDSYARQIEWMQQNDIQTTATSAPRLDSRAPIEPLVTAHWDQGSPFYNSCPKKGSRKTYTGCVATAMAEVMHYYQYPDETQTTIPSYITRTQKLTVDEIPQGSPIDWGNILEGYGVYYDNNGTRKNQSSNATQKAAVADLMLYCGASVTMDFTTDGSGTTSALIPAALKNVFGYDNTARLVERNLFSATNWEEVIYYELANSRPVLYSGVTNNSEGHEFVCDGYQEQESKAYFHINWGWASSGNVDGYFLLSALDPDSQGAGGASSGDAFNYEQDAVIGIQPPGFGGDISPVVASVYPLELVDVSFSQNPAAPGSSVKLTATIKNIGSSKYNNSIVFVDYSTEDQIYTTLNISAGQTKTVSVDVSVPSDRSSLQYCIFFSKSYSWYSLGASDYLIIASDTPEPPSTMDITFADSEWMLFSNANALDFTGTGVKSYIVTGISEDVIQKKAIQKSPAETGLLLNGLPNQTYTLNIITGSTDDVTGNRLVAVLEDGKSVAKIGGGTTRFILGIQEEMYGFAKLTSTITLNAGDAYLALEGSSSTFSDWLTLEPVSTGINTIDAGQRIMDNIYYDLSGRRVKNPTTGVYILNGKKVVINSKR